MSDYFTSQLFKLIHKEKEHSVHSFRREYSGINIGVPQQATWPCGELFSYQPCAYLEQLSDASLYCPKDPRALQPILRVATTAEPE